MHELYLVPYAGGTSLSYNKWTFSESIRCIALDYRGHGLRRKEKLDDSFDDIVHDLTDQIESKTKGGDISIFGHSMGGMTGWKTTLELEKQGLKVANLFISACVPPHCFNEQFVTIPNTKTDVMEYIQREKRLTPHQIESKYFKELVYPTIVNDYRILSSIPTQKIISSEFNISCLFGENDPVMNPSVMELWKKYTCKGFKIRSYDGDHYYIEVRNHLRDIIAFIEETILQNNSMSLQSY